MRKPQHGPLNNIHVLNIATMLAANHMTSLIADFNADMIHIKIPNHKNNLHQINPFKDNHSLHWAIIKHNKRSITTNLHNEHNQKRVHELTAATNVIIKNFQPNTITH